MLLEIRAESDHLIVDAMGKFSLEEAKRTFLEILEAIALHKLEKVMVDGRKLTGIPKTMERFYLGVFAAQTVADYAKRGISPATRFAYVLIEPVLHPKRFGETVAVNRGMVNKVFDNPEDALQWLRIAPANKPDAGAGK
jgi:hypothetical protein